MTKNYICIILLILQCLFIPSCNNHSSNITPAPKIVNIINFIRQCEPRDERITEKVLYDTVAKQIEIMQNNKLGGTFLLQYDALINPAYQQLLKTLPSDSFEIGAWWEITQPHVEKAGLKWRGRYPWDWHADVGFSTGYTPKEREVLVDVYMAEFKQIFGYYPKSAGSWFIDAHTLNYMYEKYHIIASCNCKDQYGTDGYTLWGGYWNQAYYPSKVNSYMPAQNAVNQIPVPIFRMLGSDPVRQYDSGLGSNGQGVITLEPVYSYGGGDQEWTNWFFREFVHGEAMEFAYVQAGQENSFTWQGMKKGYEYQIPLIAKLRDQGKVKVETLSDSAKWFKANYKLTPATSVTVNQDIPGSELKTVWYNCRNYRANILWENGSLKFRDIHLFDESVKSDYLFERVESNECKFLTLPIVDGFLWSDKENFAGLRLKAVIDGEVISVKGGAPVITSPKSGKLNISWPLETVSGVMKIVLDESKISIKADLAEPLEWYLELTTAPDKKLPFNNVEQDSVHYNFYSVDYVLHAKKGYFESGTNTSVFSIKPESNIMILRCKLK